MLILTRKKQESIFIGDNIQITILEVEGDRVKIGIKAPKDSTILRAELLKETQDINLESTKASPTDLQGFLKNMNINKK